MFDYNGQDIKSRIQKLMDLENIQATQFAEATGIQRSSVSHILSGRNDVSKDVLIKILQTYPNIATDWLLFGKEPMYKKDYQPDLFSSDSDMDQETEQKKSDDLSSKLKEELVFRKTQVAERKVEKVVVFYNDNTYESFILENRVK